MTSTVVIPRESMVSLYIPPSYIGKKVEVVFTLIDEDTPKPAVKLSEMFRGVFSKEDTESFVEHTKKMREEWSVT